MMLREAHKIKSMLFEILNNFYNNHKVLTRIPYVLKSSEKRKNYVQQLSHSMDKPQEIANIPLCLKDFRGEKNGTNIVKVEQGPGL
jgi:hypothetical protein